MPQVLSFLSFPSLLPTHLPGLLLARPRGKGPLLVQLAPFSFLRHRARLRKVDLEGQAVFNTENSHKYLVGHTL